MAIKPKKPTAPAAAPEYVTKKELGSIIDMLADRFDKIDERLASKVAAPVSVEEQKVIAAGPNRVDTNPEWDEEARKILADLLDHTEVAHERSGGIKFTVVIKKEKSNAPEEYLKMFGQDRRTKDVSSTGMEGVIEWCKLIRSNLRRTARE